MLSLAWKKTSLLDLEVIISVSQHYVFLHQVSFILAKVLVIEKSTPHKSTPRKKPTPCGSSRSGQVPHTPITPMTSRHTSTGLTDMDGSLPSLPSLTASRDSSYSSSGRSHRASTGLIKRGQYYYILLNCIKTHPHHSLETPVSESSLVRALDMAFTGSRKHQAASSPQCHKDQGTSHVSL